jgi:hypothetical protein
VCRKLGGIEGEKVKAWFYIFFGKENENHASETRFFVYHRILSTVKRKI